MTSCQVTTGRPGSNLLLFFFVINATEIFAAVGSRVMGLENFSRFGSMVVRLTPMCSIMTQAFQCFVRGAKRALMVSRI
jgi:hypothetical protein